MTAPALTPLAGRINALARLGARRVALGSRLIVLGLCLAGALPALAWPGPRGHDAFDSYVAVPEPLFALLAQRGAGVRDVVGWLVSPNAFGWYTACYLPLFFLAHAGLKRVVRRRGPRIAIMAAAFMTSPLWLSTALAPTALFDTTPRTATGARTGIIVDHGGAPPAPADGTTRPPVPAYRLDPASLPQPMADQARYVLAQQAYLDDDPARMARHLAGLTGAWRPGATDRVAIGLMVEHGAAVGAPVPGIAPLLAGGAAHSAWRRAAYGMAKWLAILAVAAGVLLNLLGRSRIDHAAVHTAKLARPAARSMAKAPANT